MAEFHMEERGENIITKDQLLAIGDKYEAQIAKAREQDKDYR
jgi:NADH-quinone oxidoreductase subunit I